MLLFFLPAGPQASGVDDLQRHPLYGQHYWFLTVQLAATAWVCCAMCWTSWLFSTKNFFSSLMLYCFLLIPFGTDGGWAAGWLDLPGFPVNIQPAEICKITFTILFGQGDADPSKPHFPPRSVLAMAFQLIFLVGLNMVLSGCRRFPDLLCLSSCDGLCRRGVKLWWFLGGFAALAAAVPYVWTHLMQDYQKNRILVIFDPTIDPEGLDERWHFAQSLRSLTGGGLSGQGLFHGSRTQVGALNAQHTDFIFSAIGEELGLLGCAFTLVLLGAVVFRVIYVGLKTPDYLSRLVCLGTGAALIFQICVNVGMCLGLMPVIGLTLPFISYGGSSIVSLFLAMGVVSSVHAHPRPEIRSRYVRPPQQGL